MMSIQTQNMHMQAAYSGGHRHSPPASPPSSTRRGQHAARSGHDTANEFRHHVLKLKQHQAAAAALQAAQAVAFYQRQQQAAQKLRKQHEMHAAKLASDAARNLSPHSKIFQMPGATAGVQPPHRGAQAQHAPRFAAAPSVVPEKEEAEAEVAKDEDSDHDEENSLFSFPVEHYLKIRPSAERGCGSLEWAGNPWLNTEGRQGIC